MKMIKLTLLTISIFCTGFLGYTNIIHGSKVKKAEPEKIDLEPTWVIEVYNDSKLIKTFYCQTFSWPNKSPIEVYDSHDKENQKAIGYIFDNGVIGRRITPEELKLLKSDLIGISSNNLDAMEYLE